MSSKYLTSFDFIGCRIIFKSRTSYEDIHNSFDGVSSMLSLVHIHTWISSCSYLVLRYLHIYGFQPRWMERTNVQPNSKIILPDMIWKESHNWKVYKSESKWSFSLNVNKASVPSSLKTYNALIASFSMNGTLQHWKWRYWTKMTLESWILLWTIHPP